MPVTYQRLIGGNKHLMAEGIRAIRLIIKHCFAPFWVFFKQFLMPQELQAPGASFIFRVTALHSAFQVNAFLSQTPHWLLVQDTRTYPLQVSARMCLNVTFASPVAHRGQVSAFTSVDESITAGER